MNTIEKVKKDLLRGVPLPGTKAYELLKVELKRIESSRSK